MKQDKNFTVRLKATIERIMHETGVQLPGSAKAHSKFFQALDNVKLTDINKLPEEPPKQYWLATATAINPYGTILGPFTPVDGPHSTPEGVTQAHALYARIHTVRFPEGTLFCMLEVSPVQGVPVKINQEAVDTLNKLLPKCKEPHIQDHSFCLCEKCR